MKMEKYILMMIIARFISKTFYDKLHNYTENKLNVLMTKMHEDIFINETVYTGSGGLALFYIMCYMKDDESNDNYLKMSLQFINLNNLKGHRISFLCGDAGPLALATFISHKLGNKRPSNLPEPNTLAQRLLDLLPSLKQSPNELLYGGAGYLYALLFVKKYIPEANLIQSDFIERVVNDIIKSGKTFSSQMKSDCPLLWQWHDKIYLGAAHGVSGILYLLLQARDYVSSQDMKTLIKPTLDWLADKQFSSGNFPSSLGSSSGDRLVQWCHGAPGFIPLFLLAHQIFKEEKYVKIALKSCEVIWQRGLCTKGYSICHGVSGNAYSFLYMYQATKDPIHLYRACCFMQWCLMEKSGTELHSPDRPASLFEGLLGRLYLAKDMMFTLDKVKFPAFSL
ncbi:lanC-like protein 2 isoform X2 [Battus philenor]|uniref:lanC-like protein 2 isoform X2 n=1 Tax=Battus philenor TaxID=42288 RepID=UPI0035D0C1DB